jgi:hypothetical protein
MKMVRTEIIESTVEIPSTLDAFKTWEFSSGPSAGPDFKVFVRLFRSFVKKNLPIGAALAKFYVGHYECSGFIEKDGKCVYFSISDVRYYKAGWADDILIRTARGINDFTGGLNGCTSLEMFCSDVSRMLMRG